jgi:hypothetical protein
VNLWRRPVPAEEPALPPAPPTPASTLAYDFGEEWCSFRGCGQKTGLACSYVDRHGRSCPTAWCPQHRYITDDEIFCPTHGRFLDGTQDEFHRTVHVDIGNVVPMVLSWIVQEVDDAVVAEMTELAAWWHQALVIDPVRFALVGVERVRTWERAWKVCDELGPTLRLAVVIEEAEPGVAEARVQSKMALRLPIPWHEDHGFGERPGSTEQAETAVADFRRRLVTVLLDGVASWQRQHPAVPEAHPPGGGAAAPEPGGGGPDGAGATWHVRDVRPGAGG